MRKLFPYLLLGLALRLLLALFASTNYDLQSYQIVANIVRAGGNIYAETTRYNYSPLWSFVLALPVNPRVLLSFVDVTNAVLIWRIAGQRAGIFYALNPLSILIVGYLGQFETLAALSILLALYYKKGMPLLCALAIIIKHDLIFVAWTVLVYRYGWRRASVYMLTTVTLFLTTFLPYRQAWQGIIHNVFLYASFPYGLGIFSHYAILGLLLVPVVPLITQRQSLNLRQALTLTVLAQFILMSGMGEQYWILIPLFIYEPSIQRSTAIWVMSAEIAFGYLMMSFGLVIPLLINVSWLLSLTWLPFEFRRQSIRRIAVES